MQSSLDLAQKQRPLVSTWRAACTFTRTCGDFTLTNIPKKCTRLGIRSQQLCLYFGLHVYLIAFPVSCLNWELCCLHASFI